MMKLLAILFILPFSAEAKETKLPAKPKTLPQAVVKTVVESPKVMREESPSKAAKTSKAAKAPKAEKAENSVSEAKAKKPVKAKKAASAPPTPAPAPSPENLDELEMADESSEGVSDSSSDEGTANFPEPIMDVAGTEAAPSRFHSEYSYLTEQCEIWGGEQEYLLKDNSRIDCVTEDLAVEFEFAKNWKNAVGPALHGAGRTGKTPAIALILTNESDEQYVQQLFAVKKKFGLDLRIFKIRDSGR